MDSRFADDILHYARDEALWLRNKKVGKRINREFGIACLTLPDSKKSSCV